MPLHGYPFTIVDELKGKPFDFQFDSHKWPTVLVCKVNHAISSQFCVDHYILLLNYLSNHLNDQLVLSKATCSFKITSFIADHAPLVVCENILKSYGLLM